MVAKSSIIKKTGMELVGAFAKSAGSEAGKRVVNGKTQSVADSNLNKIKVMKEIEGMFDAKIPWENVDNNLNHAGGYIKEVGPVVAATALGYFTLPVIVGASAFAIAGTSAATMAYTSTNILVLASGGMEFSRRIVGYTSKKKAGDAIRCEEDLMPLDEQMKGMESEDATEKTFAEYSEENMADDV